MLSLILGIISLVGSVIMWLGVQMSDPSNTQASHDAADRALAIGLGFAVVFAVCWWVSK